MPRPSEQPAAHKSKTATTTSEMLEGEEAIDTVGEIAQVRR